MASRRQRSRLLVRQSLDCGNGKRIIPGGNDSDHPIRLAHQLATLCLHGKIAMRQGSVAKERMSVAYTELAASSTTRISVAERLGRRLASLPANKASYIIPLFAQQLLKTS